MECKLWGWNNWNGTKGVYGSSIRGCSKEFCNETIDLGGKSSQICIDNCFYWQKTWNSPLYYYLRPPLFRSVCSTGQIHTAIVNRTNELITPAGLHGLQVDCNNCNAIL